MRNENVFLEYSRANYCVNEGHFGGIYRVCYTKEMDVKKEQRHPYERRLYLPNMRQNI